MRLAVAVHAASSPTSRHDAQLVRARLAAEDAGFAVVDLPAYDDLALGLPRALAGTERSSSVLVHVSAEIARSASGAVEIVGAARNVRFDEIRSALVAAAATEALLVVDGVHVPAPGEELDTIDVAAAIARAVAPASSGVATLVALRHAKGDGSAASPFTSLFFELAERIAASSPAATATASETYAALRDDPRVHDVAAALVFVPAETDLALLRPAPRPPLFSITEGADRAFDDADRLLGEGKLDDALEACKRVLLLAGDDPARRAEVFVRIAAIKKRQGKDREAAFTLEKALSIDPHHRSAIEALLLGAIEQGRFDDVASLGERLLAVLDEPEDRFRAYVDLGRAFQDHAHDEERAAASFEQARALHPDDPELLERLVVLHDRARRLPELARVLEAFAGATSNVFERAARLAAAAKVVHAALADRPRAIRLYDEAIQLRRDDPELWARMAELLEQEEHHEPALQAFQRAAVFDARQPDTFHAIVRIARRLGRDDVAYQAANVLDLLGEADIDEQIFAEQHRPEGPTRPQRPIDEGAWARLVEPSGRSPVVGVMEAIEAAAIRAKLAELEEAGTLPRIDPATRVDPRTSTVTAIRSLAFAARLVGIDAPDILVVAEAPNGIAPIPAVKPTTAIARSMLSGRGLDELAFLMARHLAYYRRGARVALFYPSAAELASLFVAAIRVVRPEYVASTRAGAAVGRLQAALAQGLDDASRAALDLAVGRLEEENARPDVVAWLRRLELTAIRAGMLACGDVAVAARHVESPGPVPSDLGHETKVDDLHAFAVSGACEELRLLVGTAVGWSIRPSSPPP